MTADLRLIICRGLQASGKTARARAWVATDPVRRARVNKDDLRRQLHDGVYLGADTEGQVNAARDALITRLLERGVSVVSDDTNLSQRVARDLARIGRRAGAEVEVWDLTDVPPEVCVARDARRENPVGADVIRRTFNRYLNGKPSPLPAPVDPPDPGGGDLYVPDETLPRAILVDVDGTIALRGTRSPFDETRVHEDRPNGPVIAAVRAFRDAGYEVVFCSGRTEACRAATAEWILRHVGQFDRTNGDLLMRPVGDTRKDSVVKRELFDRLVRHRWNVVCVLDDRAQVVEMWRGLGLTCLQVAEGNF